MSKICNSCGTDKPPASVPYVAHESAMARAERQTKRLVAIIILLIVLLVGSNIGWLVYESSFETVETNETIIEAEQDGSGVNIVGGGDVDYGTESEDNQTNN